MNFLKKEIKSFGYAFNGIGLLFRYCSHARIHALATVVAIGAGIYFKITAIEWTIIFLTIGSVIAAEGFNSAIEYLADKVSPEHDLLIKLAKDVAAGAVLIMAITAVIVAIFIFGEKIMEMV